MFHENFIRDDVILVATVAIVGLLAMLVHVVDLTGVVFTVSALEDNIQQ